MSLVYVWAPDAAYENGTMAAWAKVNHLNTARFPAGMASYWNWENPSGFMGVSSLADSSHTPPWTGHSAPESEWMSLEEYLSLCVKAGIAKPLIGVNYNCHNYQKCQENETSTIVHFPILNPNALSQRIFMRFSLDFY